MRLAPGILIEDLWTARRYRVRVLVAKNRYRVRSFETEAEAREWACIQAKEFEISDHQA